MRLPAFNSLKKASKAISSFITRQSDASYLKKLHTITHEKTFKTPHLAS